MKNLGSILLLRNYLAVLVCSVVVLFSPPASAQTVDIGWLQQAGISCGGGIEVEVQGEIDTAIARKLRLGSVDAEGNYRQSDVENLLQQFSEQEKSETYQLYIGCLLSLMNTATEVSGLPPREVALTSPISVDPLAVVQRGQRFVMVINDYTAVKDYSLIFTVTEVSNGSNGTPYVSFTWSNSETGQGQSGWVNQAKLIKLGESCTLVPYSIDPESGQVSLLSNC